MKAKHFELTDEFVVNLLGVKLFRIRCTKKTKYANVGDLGGFIEKEDNLYGDAWVSDNARVSGNAWVSDNARVHGNARVYDNACVSGDANLSGNACVYGDAWVSGEANLSGNAWVHGDAWVDSDNKHCGFDCFGSANRHTHAYLTKDNTVEVTCGCFRGSLEAFEKQVEETHKGTDYEKQYKAIINVIKIKFSLPI